VNTYIMIDLDHTLVISPITKVLNDIRKDLAKLVGVSEEYVYRVWLEIEARYVAISSPKAFDWNYILEEVSRTLNVKYYVDTTKLFHDNCKDVEVLDNAYTVLEILRSMGYILVLATNGLSKYQLCVIRGTHLDRYFDYMVFPDTTGCLKNCRRFYEEFASRGKVITVGDSYFFDVYYPKLFGFKSIFVYRGYMEDIFARIFGIDTSIEPDATIDNLQSLPKILPSIGNS